MKTWYMSKTLWLNVIALAALIIQTYTGFVIDIEAQGVLLSVINLILRAITGAPLSWGNTPAATEPISTYPPEGGFINLRCLVELFLIGCLALILCAGCVHTNATGIKDTPLQTAGKSLLAVKSTIVTAATATANLCQAGKIEPANCDKAKIAYEVAKPAYDTAVDAYLLMSSGGADYANFDAALNRVQNLAAHLLQLSGDVNPLPIPLP